MITHPHYRPHPSLDLFFGRNSGPPGSFFWLNGTAFAWRNLQWFGLLRPQSASYWFSGVCGTEINFAAGSGPEIAVLAVTRRHREVFGSFWLIGTAFALRNFLTLMMLGGV